MASKWLRTAVVHSYPQNPKWERILSEGSGVGSGVLLTFPTCLPNLRGLLRSSEVSKDCQSSEAHNFKATDLTHHLYFFKWKKKPERKLGQMSSWSHKNNSMVRSCRGAYETQNSWGLNLLAPFVSRSLRSNAPLPFWVLRTTFRNGRQDILWARPGLWKSSHFVFWQVTCLLPLRPPSIHSGFCQREVPDSVFWAFPKPVCLLRSLSSREATLPP